MTKSPSENAALIRKVLGDAYLALRVVRLIVDEALDESAAVKITVAEGSSVFDVEGRGVGMVDAIYAALLARYAITYQSLKTVTLASFELSADVASRRVVSGADAMGTVTIDALNSEGRRFSFSDSSRSLTASTARAVLAVIEYFVNAERAFLMLDRARRDALSRGRDDLATRYLAEMADVVESTSYADVIATIRKEISS